MKYCGVCDNIRYDYLTMQNKNNKLIYNAIKK